MRVEPRLARTAAVFVPSISRQCDHEHGVKVRLTPQPPAQLDPIHPGHADIEEGNLRPEDARRFQSARAVIHDADLMADFHGYVDSLPDEERVLFDLLYYRGLTTAAAAEYLGLPPTTLKRQWVRARLRARERFGRDPTET